MTIAIKNYCPPDPSLWQGRKDSLTNQRFFQAINLLDPTQNALPNAINARALIGFASDVGVKRNAGRTGAAQGPDAIRMQLAKLPQQQNLELYDLGTVCCQNDDLEFAQEQLAHLIQYCHQSKLKTVVLGGGHEIAWGHYQGLAKNYPRLGIINFDAHFDLRPLMPSNLGHSGTPFRQISLYCQAHNLHFDYLCLGIQPHANIADLFAQAKELDVKFLTAEEINLSQLSTQKAFLEDFLARHQAIYLSICLDVFAECIAPGVSAPQPLGLFPWQVLPLVKYIMQTGKVISIDVAELAPKLDANEKTARLAAMLIAEIIDL